MAGPSKTKHACTLYAALKALYDQQAAHVHIKAASRKFALERGVKQGDPISALLFIAVMQDLCNHIDKQWQELNMIGRNIKIGIEIYTNDIDITALVLTSIKY